MVHPKLLHIRFISLFILILNLNACGGSSPNKEITPKKSSTSTIFNNQHITFDSYEIEINKVIGSSTSALHNVHVYLSTEAKNKIANNGTAYFTITHSDDDTFKIVADINGDSGSFRVITRSLRNLAIGTYIDEVVVEGCYDSACTQVFGRNKFTYKVNIRPEPTLSSSDIIINYDKNNPTSPGSIDLNLEDYFGDWQYSVEYINAPQDWLSIEQTSNNGVGKLDFNVDANLACGVYTADLIISIEAFPYHKVRIPITYNLNSTSFSLLSVTPVIHYTDQPISFTMRGCGINNFKSNFIQIDKLQITEQNYRNPFELEIIAKPISIKGEIDIAVNTDSSTDSMKKITIMETTTINEQVIPFDGDYHHGSFIDNKNNFLYVRAGNYIAWSKFSLKNGQWLLTDNFPYANADLIEISADNETLLITKNNTIKLVTADTYELIDEMTDELTLDRYFSAKFLNNNQVILAVHQDDGYAKRDDMRILDVKSKTFSTLQSTVEFKHVSEIFTGSDRSQVIAVADSQALRYNPLEGRLQSIGNISLDLNIEMNQNSDRFIVKKDETFKVFDDKFVLLAQLPKSIEESFKLNIRDAVITPDGKKAYAIYDTAEYWNEEVNFLATFNLTAVNEDFFAEQSSIKQLKDVATNQPTLKISGTNKYLFIISDDKVFITPLD